MYFKRYYSKPISTSTYDDTSIRSTCLHYNFFAWMMVSLSEGSKGFKSPCRMFEPPSL